MLEWKEHKDLIRPGVKGFLGNIQVGFVDKIKGKYRANCKLPGVRKTCGYYVKEESAKEAIRKGTIEWISAANLELKNENSVQ